MDDHTKEDELTLRLLQAIDERSDITQRRLSQRLGVALGLTNSYLKRCMRKGLIKFKQVPANRYAYYLTPKGFAEKSRLTASYLTVSFDFYRSASRACKDVFDRCEHSGWRKVVLCGASELCEIALIRIHESGLDMQGIYAPGFEGATFLGFPVRGEWGCVPAADAFVITELRKPREFVDELSAKVAVERILTPNLLDRGQFP